MTAIDLLDEPFWGAGGMGFSLAELRGRSDSDASPPKMSARSSAGVSATDGDDGLIWGSGGFGLPRPR